MKSRSVFSIGTLIILSLLGLVILNTKSITDRNLSYLKESEEENSQSFQGAAEYNRLLKADLTTGIINPDYVNAAYQQLNNMPKSRAGLTLTWNFRGPDNVGGRTRTLIIDNKNPQILYAGGVSGGIFKSITGGEIWVNKSYDAKMGGLVINCGAQAINGDLYFGTGEQAFATSGNGDLNTGNQGGGIYKSTNRGETWFRIPSTDPSATRWQNVQGIAVSPTDSNTLYAATNGGLVESNDGGNTWKTYPGSDNSKTYIDVRISPDGKTIFTANSYMGSCKVYRSIDHAPLTQSGASVISTNTIRLVIAIAPSNPNYVYVSAASRGGGGGVANGYGALEGIYQSTDNGTTWKLIVSGGTEAEPFESGGNFQGQYDHCIAVDPYNPKKFYLGGVDFYIYNEPMWYKGASNQEYANEFQLNPYYIHADKHNIVFDTVSKPYKMYVVSDGGVAISKDAEYEKYPSFKTININYTTTQFYAVAASRNDDITGGTQDNGTFRIESNSISGKNGTSILGGDGFYTEISRYDPNMFFSEIYYGDLYRSKDRGKNQQSLKIGKLKSTQNTFPFNSPVRLWEDVVDSTVIDSTFQPPKITYDSMVPISKLFIGAQNKIWMNLDAHDFSKDADKWFKITTLNFNLYPMCMEYTKDGNTLFVGGTDFFGGTSGALYRITGIKYATYKYNANLSIDSAVSGIKTELIRSWTGRTVTGIGISPGNDNNMVVTLGNYVNQSSHHVYLFTNSLAADKDSIIYKDIQGNLPSMPVYDAAIHSFGNGTDTIILTSEFGVFTSIDGGTNWVESKIGMDRVPTYMIRQVQARPWHHGFYYYIATHGRGIFSASFGDIMSIPDKSKYQRPEMSIYPNPAVNSANVTFNLIKTSNITIQVFDLNGRIIQTYNFNQSKAGKNTYPLNTSTYKSGTYLVRATVEGQNLISKLMISK